MKTIQIEIPEDIEQQLGMIIENQQAFIVEAIREKIKRREELNNKLIEGYQATYEEDQEIADGFGFSDLENWK